MIDHIDCAKLDFTQFPFYLNLDISKPEVTMTNDELLREVNKISAMYGLKAEFLGDVRTVGVRGDDRSYLPTVVLIGPFPGWKVLEQVSSEITNKLDIGKVTYEMARRVETQAEKPPLTIEWE